MNKIECFQKVICATISLQLLIILPYRSVGQRVSRPQTLRDSIRVSTRPITNTLSSTESVKVRKNAEFVYDKSKITRLASQPKNDSVLMPTATGQDINKYEEAVSKLSLAIVQDPYKIVADYIDVESDLPLMSKQQLQNIYGSNNKYLIPKLLLQQLTFNIETIASFILNIPASINSIRVMDKLIENNKTLSAQTIYSAGDLKQVYSLRYPLISVEVRDQSQTLLPSANCYFVTYANIRKNPSVLCDNSIKACPVSDFNNRLSIPVPPNQVVQLPFARYHVFVSDGENVYYVQKTDIDESIPYGQILPITLVK